MMRGAGETPPRPRNGAFDGVVDGIDAISAGVAQDFDGIGM